MELGFELEIKAVQDAGTFTGLASTFDTDDTGDRVMPGAFERTLKERGNERVLLWAHDTRSPIGLGKLQETAKGLEIAGTLDLDTQAGKDAYSRVKKGIVKGLSIGFRTVREAWEGSVRLLKDLDLYEVSLTAIPANPQAQVLAVKSQITTIRDYENFLHGAGFSKREAAALASNGFKGLSMPEPDNGAAELVAWLKEQRAAMGA